MGHSPGVSSLVRKQLRACHIEDLPSVIPHGSVGFSIGFGQMRPDFVLARDHLGQPILKAISVEKVRACINTTYLACLCVVLARNPPLGLELEISLEE